jgi:SAM-dependent methyltransferase
VGTRYDREAEFHDALVESGGRAADRFYAVNRSSWDYYRDLIVDEARLAQARHGEARILEYGSGIGAYSSLALAEAGFGSIGIDISPASVHAAGEAARSRFPELAIEYRTMNAEQLEFPDNSFDLVCGNGIVHHLDLGRAYAEIARVLKPDGVAVLSEPLGHNPLINLYRRLTPGQRTADEHPLRRKDIELAREFFGEVQERYFHLAVLGLTPLRSTHIFDRLLGVVDGFDRLLFETVPSARPLAWYVVLRLTRPRSEAAS